ncbi:ATP-binding protein [Chloroflexota bacterium]
MLDVIGQPFAVVLPKQSELIERTSVEKVGVYWNIVIEKNEEQYYYELSISPLKDSYGHFIGRLVILHDINEDMMIKKINRDLEEKAKLTNRLSIIGEMTAGIAHDLANPLTAVLGYSDLILKQDIPAKTKDDLQVIRRDTKRAVNILERLLKYSGQQGLVREYIDINNVLKTTIEFQRNSLSDNNIGVVLSLENDLPKTFADGNQLQEVFVNLIINAENSLVLAHRGKGGTLNITTEAKEGNLNINISDNGVGINEENLEKIFDPLFTTMASGKGTGLSLSICQGIIDKHGGEIIVERDLEEGASFIIKLPISVPNTEGL